MPSLTKALVLACLLIVGLAGPAEARCSGAKLVDSKILHAGDHDIKLTTHECETTRSLKPRQLTNVCGAPCTVSCNSATGILPPISQDCQTIENSVVILQGTMPPTFDVQPNHLVTLTFGTCSYFMENVGPVAIEACWSDLSAYGHADGAACFPPNQPFFPEGLCTSYDGTWAVGASHS